MPSTRSQRGLDWLNFFAADVQTGFGPFIAVYLAAHSWTEAQIGLALSLGTLTAMAGQVPAGAVVDATSHKRLVAGVALAAIAGSAALLALRADFWPVMASEVLHGVASAVLVPALAAISLALVGRGGLSHRLGRNGRYASLGNASAAALLGLLGAYVSAASVFWMTALLTLPALAALRSIRSQDLTERVRRIHGRGSGEGGLRRLLTRRGVLVFAGVCCLFTAANAAMLPLSGAMATHQSGGHANLVVAGGLIASQLMVAAISPWLGRFAEARGRRMLLLAGLSVVPLRGALLAFFEGHWVVLLAQALDGINAAVFVILVPLVAADLTRGTNRFNLCMGIFGLAVGVGGMVSTAAAGAAASWFGSGIAFAGLGATGLLAFLLVLFAMPETRGGGEDDD